MLRRLAIALGLLAGTAVHAEVITDAQFGGETTRYAHAVLGDSIEYGTLELTLSTGKKRTLRLPKSRVFEDLAPRLQDLDGDGAPEVIVIETDANLGASLAIYGPMGKLAATPYIGRTNRWLAPIGAADFDGDGNVEIGYIDRPHLAKQLRVWRYQDQTLTLVGETPGLTNHRIGQDFITSGVRSCGPTPSMVMVDGGWSRIVEVSISNGGFNRQDRGPFKGTASVEQALEC